MATSPRWKVYDGEGQYVASCVHPSLAAICVAALGSGCTIRYGHRVKDVVWCEGTEEFNAMDSYDRVAEVCFARAT